MRIRKLTWTAALLCAGLLIAACMPPPEAGPAKTPEPATPPVTPSRPIRRLSDEAAVAQARRVLAERLNISADQIKTISVSKDEMPLDDLGCGTAAGRGGARSPALVLGQEIILKAGDQEYVFHSDGRRLILCRVGEEMMGEQVWPQPDEGSEESRSASPEARLVAQAVADLAGRLDIAEDAIHVRSVEAVEWSDTSLGCPQPGMMYAQVITPGYRILLEAAGQVYEYHTDHSRVVYCPR